MTDRSLSFKIFEDEMTEHTDGESLAEKKIEIWSKERRETERQKKFRNRVNVRTN